MFKSGTLCLIVIGTILLSACTTASYTDGNGTQLNFTRLWTDTYVSVSPDGSITYSSDAEASADNQVLSDLISKIP